MGTHRAPNHAPWQWLLASVFLLIAAFTTACSADAGGAIRSTSTGGSVSSGGSAGAGLGSSTGGAAGTSSSSGGSANGGAPSGGASNGGAGNPPASCTSLPLCDDFESAAVGGPPDSSKWSVVSPSCSGTGTVAIDGNVAHSGSHSLRVNGAAGFCNHVFISNQSAVPAIGKQLYGRLFVRFGAAFDASHTTFMAFHDSGDNKDLRMGSQNAALMWNRESNDATLPVQSPVGVGTSLVPSVNEWHCLQFEVDQSSGHIATWVDGTAVPGLQDDGVPTPDIDQVWISGGWIPSLTDARFGWESYGTLALTLWFDDIALGSTKIACN